MIDAHVWFNAGQVRVTIPMDDNTTADDLKQTIDDADTPLHGVGVAAINLFDHATGNLVPGNQQLADDDEFDAALANGIIAAN
jgi:hypothetical protein